MNMRSEIKSRASIVVLVLIIFPYLSFGLTNFDTQPWYIVASLIYIYLYKQYIFPIPGHVLIAAVLALLVLPVGLLTGSDIQESVRAFASYAGFASTLLFVHMLIKQNYRMDRVLLISFYIWVSAGVLQLLLGSEVLGWIVTARTTLERGVTGLAPEPSFYAITIAFMFYAIFLERGGRIDKVASLTLFVSFVTIVVIAKSTLGLIIFLFILFLVICKLGRLVLLFRAMLIIVPVVFVLMLFTDDVLQNSRIYNILPLILSDPLRLISSDISVAVRLSHIFTSFGDHFYSYGLPHGFSSFELNSNSIASVYANFYKVDFKHKILSGVGSALYEMGWFGYLYLLVIYKCSSTGRTSKSQGVVTFLVFAVITSAAIPIGYPILPLVLSLNCHSRYQGRLSLK